MNDDLRLKIALANETSLFRLGKRTQQQFFFLNETSAQINKYLLCACGMAAIADDSKT
jgi:hypothetical protein